MINYDNANYVLINKFPKMREIYLEDEDYYEDLPYLFYESEFTPYIMKLIDTHSITQLKEVFEFIEKLLEMGDERLRTLVGVSVVESLFFENKFMENFEELSKLMGEHTLMEFHQCTDFKNTRENEQKK